MRRLPSGFSNLRWNWDSELRYNRIPCIVRANQQSSKTMPYLIRYNNLSQIEIAIEEALIMDRSYLLEIEHISWEETVVKVLQQIISDSEKNLELTYDYLRYRN